MQVFAGQALALVGANGMLAQMVRKELPAGVELSLLDLPDFDITDSVQVADTLRQLAPAAVINCAAFTRVDECETHWDTAFAVNGDGPGHLAGACAQLGCPLVHISTDYVFDGTKTSPYLEEDVPNPQSVYGASKLAGEQAIRESGLKKYFIVRTSWLYGPGGHNFVETIIRLAGQREELRVVADQVGSPTYTRDLARGITTLLATEAYGLYHFADEGQCSWHGFAERILFEMRQRGLPLKTQRVVPLTTAEYPLPARRPAWSVFDKSKFKQVTGQPIPWWSDSLSAYFDIR